MHLKPTVRNSLIHFDKYRNHTESR